MNAQLKMLLLNGELNGREILFPTGDFTLLEQRCEMIKSARSAHADAGIKRMNGN